MMTFSFEKKVALVTGAGSGIGLATAKAFAKAGASVVLADINETDMQAAVKELSAEGYRAMAIRCNVANESDVASMIDRTVADFGKLDIAYNNAGMHVPVAETADATGEDFDLAISVNLKGIWNCMKYELLRMRKQESGVIVNCSSQSGIVGTAGLGAYTASKHGVIGLTRSAALEYAPKGIRINAICPGTSDTPMVSKAVADAPEHMDSIVRSIPLGRLGRLEEIASTVLWLCSEGAGFMIGQAVVPDGGYTVK